MQWSQKKLRAISSNSPRCSVHIRRFLEGISDKSAVLPLLRAHDALIGNQGPTVQAVEDLNLTLRSDVLQRLGIPNMS